MRHQLLNFLLVMACAALIGLHPLRAQNPTGSSDANGNAVTAPAKQSDTASPSSKQKSEQAVPDSRRDADNAIANDRDAVATPSRGKSISVGGLSVLAVVGLLGLLVFLRRRSVRAARNTGAARPVKSNYRRAA